MSSFSWPHPDSTCAQVRIPCCSSVVRESVCHCVHSPDGKGGRRSQKLQLCWRDGSVFFSKVAQREFVSSGPPLRLIHS